MFVELHARSAFSFLEGASVPEELAELCAFYGMGAMALLDLNNVSGAPRFHGAAKKAGIKPHIGAEITSDLRFSIFDFSNHDSSPQGIDKSKIKNQISRILPRLPLLAANQAGYQNLCRLITRMKLRVPKHAPPDSVVARPGELEEFSEGLICLTGGADGPLAHALARGGMPEARRTLEGLIATYGRGNVYIELQRHYAREDEVRNQVAVELAREYKLPLLATNGVAYAQPNAREILDVFTTIRNGTTLEEAGRLLERNSERHLKPAAAMQALFRDLPEAIANTAELSSRLDFTMDALGYQFPRYPVPEGETMMSFLRKRTEEGARERYGHAAKRELWPRAERQIERELRLIEKLELAGYFLIVWDIVRFCRDNNILAQGRGSAANSAVCYSLGITAVDPVGMDLLFERFLSEERGEWPDIDLDLPSGEQRERAIQYVYKRYGELGAAMTANVITYRGRSAAREMGKSLGFDPETLARLAALVGSWEYKDPSDTLERQFRDAGFDLRHPRIRKFFELCLRVQDLPRHLGQHSGGMVICQGQLDSVVPLEPAAMAGRNVIQWDKDDCADMGIIKVDLLGLGMMAVLEDSIKLIRRHQGEEVDLAHLPENDPTVYAALQKADTVGMFQIESRAQMSCLPRLHPTRFYDIVVQIAIIRPGPIVGKMVHPYLARRNGRAAVEYPHPSLEPVLERTLGVPLFQEQLLRMAMIAAGFTGGEAEELRRAFGFKRSEKKMKDIEVKLRAGMARNGITGTAQESIIQSISSFALYGFPESHSASFALIAYASAYLKCHYLAAFTAALLNNQPMGFYHPATLVKDAQRHGLRVLPVDVTVSQWECTLETPGKQGTGDGGEEAACSAGVSPAVARASRPRGQEEVSEVVSDVSEVETQGPSTRAARSLGMTRKTREQGTGDRGPEALSGEREGPKGRQMVARTVRSGYISQYDPRPEGPAEGCSAGVSPAVARASRPRSAPSLRMGLRYVRGLREEAARAIVAAREKRPFASIDELARRVPELHKNELAALAAIGALNNLGRQGTGDGRQEAACSAGVSPAVARASRPRGEEEVSDVETQGPSTRAPRSLGMTGKAREQGTGDRGEEAACSAGVSPAVARASRPRGEEEVSDVETQGPSTRAPRSLGMTGKAREQGTGDSGQAVLSGESEGPKGRQMVARTVRSGNGTHDEARPEGRAESETAGDPLRLLATDYRLPIHRRDALWQVELATRRPGPLLETIHTPDGASPLAAMTDDERLVADFRNAGLTVGPHPMAYRRAEMIARGVRRAVELPRIPHGRRTRIAGCVIARQRPGTASGFVFLSIEDETGIANAIITPDLFEKHRLMLVSESFLLIDGVLQQQDGVISVKAERVEALRVSEAQPASHDFH